MPLSITPGNLLESPAQTLVVGLNAQAGVEVTPLETALRDQYPVFFSEYRRAKPALGTYFLFKEGQPWLLGLVIKESPASLPKPRHLEQALIHLMQAWPHLGLQSLALGPLCPIPDWGNLKPLVIQYLDLLPIPTTLYES